MQSENHVQWYWRPHSITSGRLNDAPRSHRFAVRSAPPQKKAAPSLLQAPHRMGCAIDCDALGSVWPVFGCTSHTRTWLSMSMRTRVCVQIRPVFTPHASNSVSASCEPLLSVYLIYAKRTSWFDHPLRANPCTPTPTHPHTHARARTPTHPHSGARSLHRFSTAHVPHEVAASRFAFGLNESDDTPSDGGLLTSMSDVCAPPVVMPARLILRPALFPPALSSRRVAPRAR